MVFESISCGSEYFLPPTQKQCFTLFKISNKELPLSKLPLSKLKRERRICLLNCEILFFKLLELWYSLTKGFLVFSGGRGGYKMGTFARNGLIHFNRDHSFSTFAKFSEKLTFLTPDKHTYVCESGGKKC